MREFASLLQAPSPAVLTTCREDGTAVASPVWFRFRGDTFEVVIAAERTSAGVLLRLPAIHATAWDLKCSDHGNGQPVRESPTLAARAIWHGTT